MLLGWLVLGLSSFLLASQHVWLSFLAKLCVFVQWFSMTPYDNQSFQWENHQSKWPVYGVECYPTFKCSVCHVMWRYLFETSRIVYIKIHTNILYPNGKYDLMKNHCYGIGWRQCREDRYSIGKERVKAGLWNKQYLNQW